MVATVLPVKKTPKVSLIHQRTSTGVFQILLVICQIFCAAPVLQHPKSFLVKLHYFWCTIFVSSVFIATCFQEEILKINMSTIQKALYQSEYVSNNGLILLAIITFYYNKDCYRIFPQRIKEIQRRSEIYQAKPMNNDIERRIKFLVVIGALLCTATLFTDFFYNSSNVLLFLRSSTVYILPNVTMSFVIGQYWVLINLITFRYKVLNSILEDLNARQTISNPLLTEVMKRPSKPPWNTEVVLNDLRDIFAQLDTLVEDVNSVYGLIITMNFLASFLTLSIQIFVLYKISDRWTLRLWALLIYALLWIVLHTIKFVFILKGNSSLLEEKANTGAILNDIDVLDTQTEVAINRFLLQLVVKKGVHMACGMIELDMTFLGGIMSALSIYVIFLIQVDLGEITLIARAATNVSTPKS